eukprot:11168444-Lingulodinium_polyedra.AAC.1
MVSEYRHSRASGRRVARESSGVARMSVFTQVGAQCRRFLRVRCVSEAGVRTPRYFWRCASRPLAAQRVV